MSNGLEHHEEDWFEIIDIYTREQAIKDGVLVDLTSKFPSDTRLFKWNLCCTSAVWAKVNAAAKGDEEQIGAYVYDLCFMAINYKTQEIGPSTHLFKIGFPIGNPKATVLKMVVGPVGPDDPSPCLTIMLPEED